jgi:excisionase family DNA binding protein
LNEVLTAGEVARLFRCRKQRALELLSTGVIPSRRLGRTYLVSKAAALAWLEDQDDSAGEKEAET